MLSLFRPLIDRVKALLALSAAQELQADATARQAERKAELYRKADDYEAEGLAELAGQLRREAERLDDPQPLGVVLNPVEYLLGGRPHALPAPAEPEQPARGSGRKGR